MPQDAMLTQFTLSECCRELRRSPLIKLPSRLSDERDYLLFDSCDTLNSECIYSKVCLVGYGNVENYQRSTKAAMRSQTFSI